MLDISTCLNPPIEAPSTCEELTFNWAKLYEMFTDLCSTQVEELAVLPTFDIGTHLPFYIVKVTGGNTYISNGNEWIDLGGSSIITVHPTVETVTLLPTFDGLVHVVGTVNIVDGGLAYVSNGVEWLPFPQMSFDLVPIYLTQEAARIALASGSLFRWDESNIDGVPSPGGTALGVII